MTIELLIHPTTWQSLFFECFLSIYSSFFSFSFLPLSIFSFLKLYTYDILHSNVLCLFSNSHLFFQIKVISTTLVSQSARFIDKLLASKSRAAKEKITPFVTVTSLLHYFMASSRCQPTMSGIDFSNDTYFILKDPLDWATWIVQLERYARLKGVWEYITITPEEVRQPFPEEPPAPDTTRRRLANEDGARSVDIDLKIYYTARGRWVEKRRAMEDVFTFFMNTVCKDAKAQMATTEGLPAMLDELLVLTCKSGSYRPLQLEAEDEFNLF